MGTLAGAAAGAGAGTSSGCASVDACARPLPAAYNSIRSSWSWQASPSPTNARKRPLHRPTSRTASTRPRQRWYSLPPTPWRAAPRFANSSAA
eukprot:8197807-Pyramimonas_sp.AAC.1